MNYKEFSGKIKSKYPDYSDMDDRELAQKMVAKYPEYSDVTFDQEPEQIQPQAFTQPAPPPTGIIDRFKQRSENVMAPTVTAEVMGLKPGIAADIVGAPERTVRAAAGAAGSLADIAATGIGMAGKAANRLSGGHLGKIGGKALETAAPVLEPVAKIGAKYQEWKKKQPESTQVNLGFGEDAAAGLGMFEAPGAARIAAKAPGKTLEGIGKAEIETGKKWLGGELKIKDALAKQGYGGNIFEKKKTIIDNMVKHDIIGSNFEKSAQKADALFKQKTDQRDAILKELSTGPDAPEIIPTNILSEVRKYTVNDVPLGKERQAEAIVENIIAGAKERGLDKAVTLDKFIEVRKLLDPDGKLFSAGPMVSDADALDRGIRKRMYLAILDKAEEIDPRIRDLGREQKEILDAKAAFEFAQSRIANKQKPLSFSDQVGMLGAGLGTIGAGLVGSEYVPGAIAASLAFYGIKKAGEQGRAAGALIGMGKLTKKTGEALNPSRLGGLGKKLSSELGSVGVVNPQVHTPEFKNWFGDWQKAPEQASKVVDADGKPLVVYHGTKNDFTVFDPEKGRDGMKENYKIPNYFSSDPKISNGYSGSAGYDYSKNRIGYANIKPVFLNVKKMWDYENHENVKDAIEKLGDFGKNMQEK